MTLSKFRHALLYLVATVLLLCVAVIIFILTFNWNRARPYINRTVSASTGRVFAIDGDLAVHFKQGLASEQGWRRYVPRPEISASDVRISNPGWSMVGPQMASATRVVIAVHLLPLLHKHVVLTDLVLEHPGIALQRQADGSNSWTLKDNGPSTWSVEIQRLAFADGQLRYLDNGIGLDMRAKVASIGASDTKAAAAPAGQSYGLQFELSGSYNQAPVTGHGKTGAVLTLEDNKTTFPVQLDAHIGHNHIAVEGTLTDPRALAGINLQLTLGGDSMGNLYPLTGVLLPTTPPYATHGRLLGKKSGSQWDWTYQHFTGKVGGSDLAGTLEYLSRQPRPLLRGSLVSEQLRLQDLGPAIGADSNAAKQARGQRAVQPAGKALPVEQFSTAKWGALDADVTFRGKRLVRTDDIPLEDINTHIRMQDKVLRLAPLNFGMAGGNVISNISLDGRPATINAQIKLAARHLQLRKLFPKLQSMQASFGEVNGDAALTGHGNSVAAMLATSNGEVGAVVSEGSVSKFILEAAGLNVANVVFVKLFGDKQVHLNCLAADFGVRQGRASTRQFVLDTDEAVIDVSGDVALTDETLNLDIRPQTKGVRIFSLRTPLYAKGTFKNPDVGPYKGPLILKGGAALALAAVAPLAAVLPLVNVGNTPDTDCAALLKQANTIRADPRSTPTAAPAPAVSAQQIAQARHKN